MASGRAEPRRHSTRGGSRAGSEPAPAAEAAGVPSTSWKRRPRRTSGGDAAWHPSLGVRDGSPPEAADETGKHEGGDGCRDDPGDDQPALPPLTCRRVPAADRPRDRLPLWWGWRDMDGSLPAERLRRYRRP